MPVFGGAPLCNVCNTRVYMNEGKTFRGGSWHKKCFLCVSCKKVLETGTANLVDSSVYCNVCIKTVNGAASQEKTVLRTEYVNVDDPECCPRCGKRVYFAEKLVSLGRNWHKHCFTCAACKKKVEAITATDHDKELYCRSCYSRNFGPKGYGFAGGSGMGLSMDSGMEDSTDGAPTRKISSSSSFSGDEKTEARNSYISQLSDSNAEYCPRCEKKVYVAEKVQAAGNAYHKNCFKCGECKRSLEAGKLTEKEGDIYCNNCYGKKFGPAGCGFGAGFLRT